MGDRRPLKSRQTRWAHALAMALVRARIRPNAISIFSVVAAIGALALYRCAAGAAAEPRAILLIAAAVCIQIRLLCNLMDGLVAVEGKMGSKSGEVYNDLPDRFADAFILVGAGCAIATLPYARDLGWCAAVLAVGTAYVRLLGAALGTGHDFRGPMAKPQRMATLTVASLIDAGLGFTQYRDYALYAALIAIIAGALITAARRTIGIMRTLESR